MFGGRRSCTILAGSGSRMRFGKTKPAHRGRNNAFGCIRILPSGCFAFSPAPLPLWAPSPCNTTNGWTARGTHVDCVEMRLYRRANSGRRGRVPRHDRIASTPTRTCARASRGRVENGRYGRASRFRSGRCGTSGCWPAGATTAGMARWVDHARSRRFAIGDPRVVEPGDRRTVRDHAETAGNHVEHIYAKIEVSNRPRAALFAMKHGLYADFSSFDESTT